MKGVLGAKGTACLSQQALLFLPECPFFEAGSFKGGLRGEEFPSHFDLSSIFLSLLPLSFLLSLQFRAKKKKSGLENRKEEGALPSLSFFTTPFPPSLPPFRRNCRRDSELVCRDWERGGGEREKTRAGGGGEKREREGGGDIISIPMKESRRGARGE